MREITVLESRYVTSWPGDGAPEGPPLVQRLPLEEALSRPWATDAHLVGYVSEGAPRRLNARAIGQMKIELPWLVFDVDCPKDRREGGRAPRAWWLEERENVCASDTSASASGSLFRMSRHMVDPSVARPTICDRARCAGNYAATVSASFTISAGRSVLSHADPYLYGFPSCK